MGKALCASVAARSRSAALAEKNLGSNAEPVAGFIPVNAAPSAPSPKPIGDTGFNSVASCIVLSLNQFISQSGRGKRTPAAKAGSTRGICGTAEAVPLQEP